MYDLNETELESVAGGVHVVYSYRSTYAVADVSSHIVKSVLIGSAVDNGNVVVQNSYNS